MSATQKTKCGDDKERKHTYVASLFDQRRWATVPSIPIVGPALKVHLLSWQTVCGVRQQANVPPIRRVPSPLFKIAAWLMKKDVMCVSKISDAAIVMMGHSLRVRLRSVMELAPSLGSVLIGHLLIAAIPSIGRVHWWA